MRHVPLGALAALALACACATDLVTTPVTSSPSYSEDVEGCEPENAYRPCVDDPEWTPTTWPFFGPPGDDLFEAANDPSPDAPGLWLGATYVPGFCFYDRTGVINDADLDWLDDGCELQLARAFAPRMHIGRQDGCPDGEPYWAAKYFLRGIVRIAYMPAYYDDCATPTLGFGGGHAGDSEFIVVEVTFNAATQHWEFVRMWLSAHYGAFATDRSGWWGPGQVEFTRRPLAHPAVWVSIDKHANFPTYDECSLLQDVEVCSNGTLLDPLRFPVLAHRNVGSRFEDLVGCVESEKRYAGNGKKECFYDYYFSFWGWHTSQYGSDPMPYGLLLLSDKFEEHDDFWDPAPEDWGPGPNPPVFDASIWGPRLGATGTTLTWSAQFTNGTGSYGYQWLVNGNLVGSGPTYSRMLGTQGFTLSLRVYDHGRFAWGDDQVAVTIQSTTSCGNPCRTVR